MTFFVLIAGFGFYPEEFWQFFEGMPQSQEHSSYLSSVREVSAE